MSRTRVTNSKVLRSVVEGKLVGGAARCHSASCSAALLEHFDRDAVVMQRATHISPEMPAPITATRNRWLGNFASNCGCSSFMTAGLPGRVRQPSGRKPSHPESMGFRGGRRRERPRDGSGPAGRAPASSAVRCPARRGQCGTFAGAPIARQRSRTMRKLIAYLPLQVHIGCCWHPTTDAEIRAAPAGA